MKTSICWPFTNIPSVNVYSKFQLYLAETTVELPESKSMRVENKMFYFDIGQNNRGTYMRVSEASQLSITACSVAFRTCSCFIVQFCSCLV